MFKKLKDKIEEEFKQAPLKFPVSVQQLAQVISPSPSVNSLSDNNASTSLTYPTDLSNVSTDFFSIGGDDDPQDGVAKMPLTLHNVDLTATSPSNMTHNMSRSRRSSLSSVTSEASLFPIYESGMNQNFFQSDLESEMEDGMSGQIEKISKEQLYQSFKKILNRYNKYKGKYTELMKHFKELQHDNFKTKNVLQESQDKALRRIAELREQCQLEQKAKAHLEESLRNDMEERDHIIDTLKTKISLLSEGGGGGDGGQLIDLDSDKGNSSLNKPQSEELSHLKCQNETLQKEIERLKKIKETACHLIHRYDTTINEATEDVKSDNLKQKLSELKTEIQKMKSENESLSHLLSRNLITEDDSKSQVSGDGGLIVDITNLEPSQEQDEKDKKIDKLNNLLLKCKEKINGLSAEIKAKNLIIEDNNKKLKELRDEVAIIKVREEENALSVAENKKAIHEELDAKEEQIKALTKELKTKENEFIKDKEEIIKNYENKIRDMMSEFTKEMKIKSDLNQKLMEDLKAKEIVSGSLDKMKNMEDSFMNMLECVKSRSSAFEEFANAKTIEIEKAHKKLEERVNTARENIKELMEKNRTAKEVEEKETVKAQKTSESTALKAQHSEENFHIVDKLKSDMINLTKKLEILESELEEAKKQSEVEKQEAEKWKKECEDVKTECEKMKMDFQEKSKENAELGKALSDKNDKIKKIENEKELLKKVSSEKVETESMLKEYVDKYNKLDGENRKLQNDLIEKSERLLKELNETKEKVKVLEGEGKAKTNELEETKNRLSEIEKKKSEENERLRKEVDDLKTEISENREKFTEELEKTKKECDGLKELESIRENKEERMKELENQLQSRETKIKELEEELENRDQKEKQMVKDLANSRKESVHEKEVRERFQNEIDAIRNNLKHELKEKEEKAILVEKLTQECNLLMAEIENLKKIHGNSEKKLENELETARKDVVERSNLIEKLQQDIEENSREKEQKSNEVEELSRRCKTLTAEIENLKQKQHLVEIAKNETISENEKIKKEISDNKNLVKELNEKISKLTGENNEVLSEMQIKQNELDILRSSLKSLKQELEERVKSFEEEKERILSENENKLKILKSEIEFINARHEEDIGNFEENRNTEIKEVNAKMEIAEKASAELLEKLEKFTRERDELKVMDEEKNLKISELENCILSLKKELDEKYSKGPKEEEKLSKHIEELKQIIQQYDREVAEKEKEIMALKLKISEVENQEDIQNRHREEVKQIIIRYDAEVANRDEEIESLKSKLDGYNDALERLKTTKEELKALRKELVAKDNLVEAKLKENKELKEDCERMEKREIKEVESVKLEDKSREHNKNINIEMTEVLADSEHLQEEVESKLASKNDSSSVELLQKQLIQQAAEMKELKKQHKKEINELKKMSSKKRSRRNSSENQDWFGGGGLENDTEHEYLRNILYEYMMGKEQLVLAKVLSAIVKFNDEQTHNVLEKEQQRQTLFGQLGLL